jgi:hypothetical protein
MQTTVMTDRSGARLKAHRSIDRAAQTGTAGCGRSPKAV